MFTEENAENLWKYMALQQGITPEEAKQATLDAWAVDPKNTNFQQQQQQQQQQQAAQQQQQQQQQAAEQQQATATATATATSDSETPKNMAYLTSTTGAKTFGGGKKKIYMTDENTGQQYVYDHEPGDYKGWQNKVTPPEGANLKVGTVLSKGKDGWETNEIADDLYFGGMADEATAKAYHEKVTADDKSDNDLTYTYNGRTYTDSSGTGQGIPVGATNITRSHSIDFDSDPKTWKEPVLSKGWSSYHDQSTDSGQQAFKADVGPDAQPFSLKNFFSIGPGKTTFKNPFTGEDITMSNPPTLSQNLEPFFNQVEGYTSFDAFKEQYDANPSWLENLLGIDAVPKTIGEVIQDTGGSTPYGHSSQDDNNNVKGDDDDDNGGGGDGDGDDDDSTTPPKFAFAPPMKSAPISTAPDEPINTDPRFQPIFPQQPIQPVGDVTNYPLSFEGPFGPGGIGSEGAPPQASPAMPQSIPIEAQPAVMPPAQSVPSVMPPETFADVMHRGGAKGQPGINPYFQDIEQINRSAPYSPIIGMAGGGGIMSLQNRMLMDPASRAMSQGIMS